MELRQLNITIYFIHNEGVVNFFLINNFQQVFNFGGLILQNRSHFFCFGEGNMYSLGKRIDIVKLAY